jgi:hypothetical protein
MDSVTLLVTLGLTFTLAVVSARQVLGGVLYFMAKNATPATVAVENVTPSQS